MRRILIFKTDRVGDLINITPVINNIKLNYKDCDIDLICSEYNSQIAKYISDIKNIYVYKNSLFNFIFNNFKNIFLTKYDVIFQLDLRLRSKDHFLLVVRRTIWNMFDTDSEYIGGEAVLTFWSCTSPP